MREKELRESAICNICDNKIMACGMPLFWKMKIERHGIKADAVQRQQGLTMILGGHAPLAAAMGPDEEMTEILLKKNITVCEDCASKPLHLYNVLEDDL